MSGRYSGWRRLKGDTAERPDLLNEGKRLLGYLDNQRTLSGVPTMGVQATLPDGSVVWARWLGNLPEIMVKEGPVGGRSTWVDGFAFRPTSQARGVQSWFGGIGTGAFEQANYRLQVLLLRPLSSVDTALDPVWYDSDALWWPGEPAPATFYRPTLGDQAFRYAANLDWTGNGGVLYFFGPPSRLMDVWPQFDRYVLHNGQILLDLDASVGVTFSGALSYVLGAALSGTLDAPGELRVAVGERTGNTSASMTIRIVTARVRWVNGRLETERDDADQHVLTDRGSYTVTRMSSQVASMFWNQQGDECRTLMPRYSDDLNEVTRYAELVATRDGNGNFTITQVAEHAVPAEEYERVVVRSDPLSLATGSIQSQYGSFAFPDIGSGVPNTAGAESDITTYAEHDWLKIAVDYRNNVPVYLEHQRKHGTRTRTRTFSRTVNATDPGDSPSSPGDPVRLNYASDTFDRWAVGAGYVNGEPWAPTGNVSTTITEVVAQEYIESYRTDFLQLDAAAVESTSVTIEQTVNATGDYFGTDVREEVTNTTLQTDVHQLAYVDLRHRLVHYQQAERTLAVSRTETITKDYGVTGASSGFSRRTQRAGPSTDTTTWSSIFTCNGVEVERTLTETDATSATDSDVTHTEASGWATWWTEASMYARLVAAPFGDPGTQTTNSVTDSEYVAPGTSWAFYAKDYALNIAAYSIGSWVRSRNLIAYSYPIETFSGSIKVANAGTPSTRAAFITGVCTTDGVKLTLDLDGLLFDDSAVRQFPILAVSPYRTDR